ncbi:MAG: ATP-binding protein [Euryarchaeota archaeon]|nr:ATP-binding protein [Euryarchaeota archaeon]
MPSIASTLEDLNPWWHGAFQLDYRPRQLYPEILSALKMRWAVALTGLRRVGKTTLLLKVAKDAIDAGLDPSRVVYFSFDRHRHAELGEVLREYEKLKGTHLLDGKFIIIFDEVQKAEGWEDQLKALYDRYRTQNGKVQFLASGSESLWLRKGMRESLAGRLVELRVDPLSYREYLDFLGVRYEPLAIHQRDVERRWPSYLRSLGFPELALPEEPGKTVVRSVVEEWVRDRALYRDLQQIVGSVDLDVLQTLVNLVWEEPGQVLELTSLSRDIGVSRPTLANYLWYLEATFLIRKLYNFSKNRRRSERKLKRYYPTVPSVDLVFRSDPEARAKVLESYTANALRAQFFWRDPAQHEVDVVLAGPPVAPVEVKSGRVETGGLQSFMRRFGVREGWVVSLTEEGDRKVAEGTIHVVPGHIFFFAPPPGTPSLGSAPLPLHRP